MVQFCNVCGNVLMSDKSSPGNLICSQGHQHRSSEEDKNVLSEKSAATKKIEIADSHNVLAAYDHRCKKCGFDKAEVLVSNPWWSDEETVYRWKCGRCGFVEQVEGKVG